ncbi:MAG: hypothetical protein NTX50_17010 [Candidatus Sumerlaeota bacterium]|nr:hypothetical protein [Candidatus Sumerlaeota bacterium]
MRIQIVGRKTEEVALKAQAIGLKLDAEYPDVIISHGGDGALLGAERDYPGVPKLALRLDSECVKCDQHATEHILAQLAAGRLKRTEIVKLRADTRYGRRTGINDIVIRNTNMLSAVRYKVWIGGELYSEELVGDGLIATTPFGSSAYYRTITHGTIRTGIGLAFNNSTEPVDHIVLSENENVRILITRGPAAMGADNDPRLIDLTEGDEVIIQRDHQFATVLAVETLLCNHCSRFDGRKWTRHGGLMTL